MTSPIPNRWLIAVMGVLLQLCLGTVYAWSYFQKSLVETYHWGNSPVAWIFSLAILFLSLAAAAGGALLPRFGLRRLAALMLNYFYIFKGTVKNNMKNSAFIPTAISP